jgi:organic hydroperoxide reductase OsmC/OhrA
MTKHHAKITWRGNRDDLRAHEIEMAGQTLPGSCSDQWGGDPGKADPEELFVASLSACHMLWFLDFARRARHRVLAYEDEPEGTLDGSRFTEVVLRPRVVFDGDVSEDALERLHHQAHEACFIANSVNCKVTVTPRLS